MRRKVLTLAGLGFGVCLIASAVAEENRIGAGAEYDAITGDAGDAWGGYVTYTRDLNSVLSLQLTANYLLGDYEFQIETPPKPPLSGDYTTVGFEVALLGRYETDEFVPYCGFGAGYYFNDYDELTVNDKLGMMFLAGFYVPLSDTLSLDLSARYRYLRPDTYEIFLPEVSMDGWVLRAGVSLQF